ncbi:zinc-dependent metalloprotease [Chitinophagaceae bacterium LB-8]|uniref:Zinc-dependent metalloprotease n=1 Tax=Paraflavisolibacter caeni TaxID=2982496 RepID=A0A9X2XN58_9BACT|nr:M57 family metalloprotease [Paraflavisolibacter caeni]MCU7548233.1 zinc-dependent metalloprotease [Paraflavisolibacter caeni]
MKKLTLSIITVGLLVTSFVSCKKDAKQATNSVSQETLTKIQNLGFGSQEVQKIAGGYLVEGDIILTESELNSTSTSPNMIIAQEEQYRTFNLVSISKHPVIKIALNNSSSQHEAAFSAALDEAIRRYNAENLQITFQRVTTGADITVVAFYENSSTLGSAGFPTSTGAPYNQIQMNTYHYSTVVDPTNTNYIATIMSHEMGHCIGLRHTDYMRRSYSCGYGGNEGQAKNGVGAVQIPGTPSGPDANSWMLACIGSGVNRPFNANDKIALGFLY